MYEKGNAELLSMIESKTFDREVAQRIAESIADFNQPILDLNGYSTTYLFEAQQNNNVAAVRFLLEHGADPNLYVPGLISDCALLDLPLLWDDTEDEVPQRLQIAKLFFDFGGDPNLMVYGETLYDNVVFTLFNDTPLNWEYTKRLLILLIAYGGGGEPSGYAKPDITEPIDKSRIHEYTLKIFQCEDGYHLEGHIFNPDGMDIGIV